MSEADKVQELDASFYEQAEGDPKGQDFDAWWETRNADRPFATILQTQVPIPDQVPAEMMLRPEKLMGMTEDDAPEMERLLTQLFDMCGTNGKEILQTLFSRGLGSSQLIVVFSWAFFNGMRPPGKPPVSFARVAKVVTEQQGKARGADQRAAQEKVQRAQRAVRGRQHGKRSAKTG